MAAIRAPGFDALTLKVDRPAKHLGKTFLVIPSTSLLSNENSSNGSKQVSETWLQSSDP